MLRKRVSLLLCPQNVFESQELLLVQEKSAERKIPPRRVSDLTFFVDENNRSRTLLQRAHLHAGSSGQIHVSAISHKKYVFLQTSSRSCSLHHHHRSLSLLAKDIPNIL